ncbi:unnamed protein product [Orchesella dallaii]|uniref:AC transposase n=1 Tax=Orchesella dallaii TaxID=48710 RepID=A0ABP1RTG1_9HEXA
MIDTMSPISVIENPAFRKLVNGIIQITMGSGSVVSVPTRKTIVTRIRDMYLAKTLEIDKLLSQQKWICATADIWSSSHRSFLGVTCHYIDVVEPFDFQRKSLVLCLKRFQGRHTADKIAEILTTVFSSYKIQDKVAAVVTDNASNFAKAFAEYGYKFSNGDEEDVLEEENSEESSDGGTISDGILEHEDLTTLLQSSCSVDLPSHVRCASHTISLIATTDFEKVES